MVWLAAAFVSPVSAVQELLRQPDFSLLKRAAAERLPTTQPKRYPISLGRSARRLKLPRTLSTLTRMNQDPHASGVRTGSDLEAGRAHDPWVTFTFILPQPENV